MKSTPTVSIGMPVFNAEAYIAEALESLLTQTYADFEIIISDNASTDQTEAICRQHVAGDPRVRYHRQQENVGAIGNFNHVFEISRGEYFKWASYDDICLPTFLQRCVEVLEHDERVVWCHTASGKIDEDGKVLNREDPKAEGLAHTSQTGLPRQFHDSPRPHQRFKGVLLGTNWCVDSYGLIRAAALRKTAMLPACYGAEKVLMGALSLLGLYREIPETLFFQRVHPAASSRINKAAEQLTFMDSKASSRFASTRLRLLSGHLRSVNSSELSMTDRLRCYSVIARYLLQAGKWSAIVRNTITGTGVGRANQTRSEQPTSASSEQQTDSDLARRVEALGEAAAADDGGNQK